MPNFSLSFDMRVPALGSAPGKIYSEALAMCEYVDSRGIDYLTIMEHHGSDDGYCPTPFVMGAAMAARTCKTRIQLGAVILPLHDPVKVAEQLAVVDLISNGRTEVVFGAGYVKSEFEAFGRSLSERAKRLDAGIPLIQRALTGERFRDGDREVYVRPLSVQKPYPQILLGGGVPATAKRAARFGAGIYPLDPAIIPIYKDECARLNRKPGPIVFSLAQIHITDDPDKTWHEVAPHVLHVAASYAKWSSDSGSPTPYAGMNSLEAIMKSGIYQVLTPDQAVKLCDEVDELGADLTLPPVYGGLDPKIGWQSIELFLNKVLPRVKKRI